MNTLLQNRLDSIQAALMVQYNAGHGLPNAMIGWERETFVREFLAKIFSPTLRFVGGAIIDSLSNECSGQIDAAVLLPSAPSFPMPATSECRLMLAENVAAVIEIKSNLSTQWNEVKATTKKVRALHKYVSATDDAGKIVVAPIPVIAVGYKGWADVGTLKEKWEATTGDEKPDAALVIENQAFVSSSILAEQKSALFGFIAYLTHEIERQSAIKTDLMRYVAHHTISPVSQG